VFYDKIITTEEKNIFITEHYAENCIYAVIINHNYQDIDLSFNVKEGYKIDKVYASGKCFNDDSLKTELPKSVLSYIEAENTDVLLSPLFDQVFYKEKVIKELVNPAFVSRNAFIKINAESYYKEIDSLVFSYLNYNGLQ
ncbi:MAG: hypothetical protein IKT74_07255, partial [Bacteroidales bacterium]|nr:hypothetical protein [Bacteroidales bacterium]